jgi:hypothetical protein
MSNSNYTELVEFDKDKVGYPIHTKLRMYIETNGTYLLNYYIAKLSHEIYKTHGNRGHIAREKIRIGLTNYSQKVLNENSDKNK